MNPFEYGGVRVLSSAGWTTRMRRPSSCAGRRSKLARKRRSCSRGMCSATCDLVRSRAISCDLVRSRAISHLEADHPVRRYGEMWGDVGRLHLEADHPVCRAELQPRGQVCGANQPTATHTRGSRPPALVALPLRCKIPRACARPSLCPARLFSTVRLRASAQPSSLSRPFYLERHQRGERGADAELTLSRSALPETGP